MKPSERKVRRPGRPVSAEIRADCTRMAELIACGMGEYDIRRELGLNRKGYLYRMRLLRKTAVDTRWLWTRYLSATQADIRTLHEACEIARRKESPGGMVRAIEAKARLRREVIEMGQALGVYDCVPEGSDIEQGDPTLGWLFSNDDDDSKLPQGNVYSLDGTHKDGSGKTMDISQEPTR